MINILEKRELNFFTDTVCEAQNITHYRPQWEVKSKDVEDLDGGKWFGARLFENGLIRQRRTIDLFRATRNRDLFRRLVIGLINDNQAASVSGRTRRKQNNKSVQFLTFITFLLLATGGFAAKCPNSRYTHTVICWTGEFPFRFKSRLPISGSTAAHRWSCGAHVKDFILAKSMHMVKITNSRHWHRTANNLEKCTLRFWVDTITIVFVLHLTVLSQSKIGFVRRHCPPAVRSSNSCWTRV